METRSCEDFKPEKIMNDLNARARSREIIPEKRP